MAGWVKKYVNVLVALVAMAVMAAALVAQANDSDVLFSDREVDRLLGPIALYPDALLSQILMAATYPAEVVAAARWSADHPGIGGDEALLWAASAGWEPSVQALVVFPDVLARMEQNIDWTQALGDAWLYQEGSMIDSIQRLREEADRSGYLPSRDRAQVYRDDRVIIIEPPRRDLVYVPYYDAGVVYGSWWRPYSSAFLWGPPPGYYPAQGVYWGLGIAIAPRFYASTFHWQQRHIVMVDRRYYRPHYNRGVSQGHLKNARRWQHMPSHRRGVDYRHPRTREIYQPHSQGRARSPERNWTTGQGRERRPGVERAGGGEVQRRGERPARPGARGDDRRRPLAPTDRRQHSPQQRDTPQLNNPSRRFDRQQQRVPERQGQPDRGAFPREPRLVKPERREQRASARPDRAWNQRPLPVTLTPVRQATVKPSPMGRVSAARSAGATGTRSVVREGRGRAETPARRPLTAASGGQVQASGAGVVSRAPDKRESNTPRPRQQRPATDGGGTRLGAIPQRNASGSRAREPRAHQQRARGGREQSVSMARGGERQAARRSGEHRNGLARQR